MCGSNTPNQKSIANGRDIPMKCPSCYNEYCNEKAGNDKLTVNESTFTKNRQNNHAKSNFAIVEVMVWDRPLTDEAMTEASEYLMRKLERRPAVSDS